MLRAAAYVMLNGAGLSQNDKSIHCVPLLHPLPNHWRSWHGTGHSAQHRRPVYGTAGKRSRRCCALYASASEENGLSADVAVIGGGAAGLAAAYFAAQQGAQVCTDTFHQAAKAATRPPHLFWCITRLQTATILVLSR